MDIVDAHHHFINLPDLEYPWIDSHPPALTALLPNYYDAARPYLPRDYRPATHELIAAFSDTTFVLEAAGWPVELTAEGFSRWEERLTAVSQFSNVVLKLQGIALIFGTSLDAIGKWVRTALSIFGARRCMFASHYPIDHLLWDSRTMVSTVQAALGDVSSTEQALFFGDTARWVYRLPAGS